MERTETSQLLDRLDRERRVIAHGGSVIERLATVTRLRSADARQFTVIHSSLTESNADEAIAGEISHHRRLGVAFEWKLYGHDSPADLGRRLARHGFEVGPHEVVLVRKLVDDFVRRAAVEVKDVVRVTTPEQAAVYRRVAEEVFGKNYEFTTNELTRELAAGSTQHRGYVAYAGQKPVGIGRLYTHPESIFGGLFGGATLPAFRGQGFYRATVAARAVDAAASGATYLMADALPTSLPILGRTGFRALTDTWPCVWRPERAE